MSCYPIASSVYGHVQSHAGNGWNEFADVAKTKRAASRSVEISGPPPAAGVIRQPSFPWLWALASPTALLQLTFGPADMRLPDGEHPIPAAGERASW